MKTLVCLLGILAPLSLSAQWNTVVHNFRKDLFGQGGQTWQIRAYDENHLYFGNKNGLLEYNGADWHIYPLDNRSDVRSLYLSTRQGRIYIGGENEFGYFEPDERGKLTYTQLSAAVYREKNISGGGYWGVYEVDNLIYYVSDRHIIKQIGDDFTLIPSEVKIDCSNIVNGILYIGTTNGMKMLVGNTILPIPDSGALEGITVRTIVPYREGCLIATAFNGLYYATEHGVAPFTTGYEAFMQRNEVFSLACSERYIAVGTIQKGLLLIEPAKNAVYYYNEQNGLQNNTVLSLCFDDRQNLWLGLDNGVDYIPLHAPYTNLYTYPNSYGAGYATLTTSRHIFFGTNRGLFYAERPITSGEGALNLHQVSELSGQVWGIAEAGGDIFCLHDKGLFRLTQDNRAVLIPGLRGAIMCTPLQTAPAKCLIGTYEGLFLIEKTAGEWAVRQKIETTDWPRNVVYIAPDTLWIRAINGGMHRLKLDTADFSVVEERMYDASSGFDSIDDLYAHEINGKACFSSASGLYEYDRATDRIVAERTLSALLLPGKSYSNLLARGDHLYALSPDMMQVVHLPSGSVKAFPFRSHTDFIKYYETLEVVGDSLVILPNENGFALLNTRAAAQTQPDDLFIKSVFITYPKDSLVYIDNYLSRVPRAEVPYAQHALRFEYGVRSFGAQSPVGYRLRLSPDNQWSDFSPSTVKEYNNLREGDYTFEVEARYSDGSVDYAWFTFRVLPPWYRSVYAMLVYFLLFLALAYALIKFDKDRTRKDREHQEQEIIKLRNENLEQELSFKSQEMANLMMHFSRKNEILMYIKQELYKVTSEMKGEPFARAKRMLLALNNSIDRNIESDDALKRFEEQFNLVHNNFMKKIREKHPDLTLGERKMCAYILMDLSSKEIAPLLNLSVRGVETLRYRLRKKMSLEREDSLTDYLRSFS
jgi:ligand-binding sensor domain-containing protein/DNA-binding CsgD family transcriptional regulator